MLFDALPASTLKEMLRLAQEKEGNAALGFVQLHVSTFDEVLFAFLDRAGRPANLTFTDFMGERFIQKQSASTTMVSVYHAFSLNALMEQAMGKPPVPAGYTKAHNLEEEDPKKGESRVNFKVAFPVVGPLASLYPKLHMRVTRTKPPGKNSPLRITLDQLTLENGQPRVVNLLGLQQPSTPTFERIFDLQASAQDALL